MSKVNFYLKIYQLTSFSFYFPNQEQIFCHSSCYAGPVLHLHVVPTHPAVLLCSAFLYMPAVWKGYWSDGERVTHSQSTLDKHA